MFGSTLAASTNEVVQNFQRQSIQCSNGTEMLPFATHTLKTYQHLQFTINQRMELLLRHLLPVGGSLEDGHFKNSSPQATFSFMPRIGIESEQEPPLYIRFQQLLVLMQTFWDLL